MTSHYKRFFSTWSDKRSDRVYIRSVAWSNEWTVSNRTEWMNEWLELANTIDCNELYGFIGNRYGLMLIETIAIQLRLTFHFQFGPFPISVSPSSNRKKIWPNLDGLPFCDDAARIVYNIESFHCYQLDPINV